MNHDVRATAAVVLGKVLRGASLNTLLPAALDAMDPRDRGLLQQLCYGTLRQAPRLQGLLQRLLDKPLRDKDSDIQALLLCGLYQLDALRVPDHAAVAATVNATKTLKKPWAKGMTNAVLRRYLRERETLEPGLDEAEALAHPAWLLGMLKKQWPDHWQQIIDANNGQPPMTLRVNTQRLTREEALQRLASAGIESVAGTIAPHAIVLGAPRDVEEIPGFSAGDFSVQDESAQMAAELLEAAPGERILDACSAPGGKTCHILELQPALAEMVAMDLDSQRLQRVEENLQRLSLQATLVTGDGAKPPATLAARSFDRILVDAPCSASGVIRRHPDIKVLRRPDDSAGFAQQQLDILQGVWPLLRPGGSLLYVTCSILRTENSDVVLRFLDTQADARLQDLATPWGHKAGAGRQLLPTTDGGDGLFFARLTKTATVQGSVVRPV
tara:strand:- start:207041 stop:208366 length:1326 start_codon:yes stop_codon:yes gene_type:complete